MKKYLINKEKDIYFQCNKRSFGIFSILLILILWQTSFSSLIIIIYHNEQLYIGSDSMAYNIVSGENFNIIKIYQLTDTSCVSITGYYGQLSTKFNFPIELYKICQNLSTTKQTLDYKINNVFEQMHSKYIESYNLLPSTEAKLVSDNDTRLVFVGYDTTKSIFFLKSCIFQGLKQPVLETYYERNAKNNQCEINFQGEGLFLPELIMSKEQRFTKLRSNEFNQILSQLFTPNSVISDEMIIDIILEMFRLHKIYASSYGFDKGLINEPYVIYKISSKSIIKIH